MNTNGSSIIMMIFEVIVVLTVLFTTYTLAENYASSERISKIHHAHELQAMIHTLVALPGDVEVEYPPAMDKYVVILTNTEVKVFLPQEAGQESLKAKGGIFLPRNYTAVGALEANSKRLCLKKTGVKILLRACPGEIQ